MGQEGGPCNEPLPAGYPQVGGYSGPDTRSSALAQARRTPASCPAAAAKEAAVPRLGTLGTEGLRGSQGHCIPWGLPVPAFKPTRLWSTHQPHHIPAVGSLSCRPSLSVTSRGRPWSPQVPLASLPSHPFALVSAPLSWHSFHLAHYPRDHTAA